MKIFFETDLEGAVGVTSAAMCGRGDKDFDYAYAELAKDINAALDGAFAGGADECVVSDGHGDQGLNWSLIDDRAIKESHGYPKFTPEFRFDAMFLIANHAMAGTINAFLDHTQSSASWFSYVVNGRPTGEMGQSAMRAALYNAPPIFLTGDEAACTEAHAFFGNIETVAVKRGLGRLTCEMYDPDESRRRIREGAKRAVEDFLSGRRVPRPYKPSLPLNITLTYMRTEFADAVCAARPDIERIDGRTISWRANTYHDIYPY